MFDWLKRRMQLAGLRSATEDLDRYVSTLQGMLSSEIGMLLAIATFIRLKLRPDGINLEFLLGGTAPLNQMQNLLQC